MITVVGTSADFASLRTSVTAFLPELLVVRLRWTGVKGAEQLLDLRRIQPDLALLVLLAGSTPQETLTALATAGRVAILTTEARAWEIRAALPLTLSGWTLIAPELLESSSNFPLRFQQGHAAGDLLSERERSVIQRLAYGWQEDAIARFLGVSVRTVQLHIAHARDKLHASDRTHAVAIALSLGLVEHPQYPGPREGVGG